MEFHRRPATTIYDDDDGQDADDDDDGVETGANHDQGFVMSYSPTTTSIYSISMWQFRRRRRPCHCALSALPLNYAIC